MADHLILDYSRQPHRMRCLHCGANEPITLPMPIRQVVVITDSFAKEHRRCCSLSIQREAYSSHDPS